MDVIIQNGDNADGFAMNTMGENARREIERQDTLDILTVIQIGLEVAQLAIYWNMFGDAKDSRDDLIDKEILFLEKLETNKETIDVPFLDLKAGVIGAGAPAPNVCGDSTAQAACSMADGAGVDALGNRLAAQCCGGVPDGWHVHEGSIAGAEAGCYAGGVLANSGKRREEAFLKKRHELALVAHNHLKSAYNAKDILTKWTQATGIYAGLADLFIQGFNSAGAALGVTLGGLATGTSGRTGSAASSSGQGATGGGGSSSSASSSGPS